MSARPIVRAQKGLVPTELGPGQGMRQQWELPGGTWHRPDDSQRNSVPLPDAPLTPPPQARPILWSGRAVLCTCLAVHSAMEQTATWGLRPRGSVAGSES